jgi:hypothetical protein
LTMQWDHARKKMVYVREADGANTEPESRQSFEPLPDVLEGAIERHPRAWAMMTAPRHRA